MKVDKFIDALLKYHSTHSKIVKYLTCEKAEYHVALNIVPFDYTVEYRSVSKTCFAEMVVGYSHHIAIGDIETAITPKTVQYVYKVLNNRSTTNICLVEHPALKTITEFPHVRRNSMNVVTLHYKHNGYIVPVKQITNEEETKRMF